MQDQGKVIATSNYNGFIIQEVQIATSGAAKKGHALIAPASSNYYTLYRITTLNARPQQFITAPSREDAERQIDSGAAKKQLESQ
jgi:hypothetical protein